MGQRGPVPNRSDDLARPRERKGGEHTTAFVTKGMSRPASIPDPDPTWHPIATLLWDSTLESGQADFYESSDYAFLFSVCDDLSYYKRGVKRSGQMLVAIYGAFERLLITEGDRRRVRVELEDADTGEDEATAEVMDEYEKGLRLVS